MTPPMSTPAREGETIEGSRPALVLKKTIKSHQRPALSRASPCCPAGVAASLCESQQLLMGSGADIGDTASRSLLPGGLPTTTPGPKTPLTARAVTIRCLGGAVLCMLFLLWPVLAAASRGGGEPRGNATATTSGGLPHFELHFEPHFELPRPWTRGATITAVALMRGPPDSPSGFCADSPSCTVRAWNAKAGKYSCGQRVAFLMSREGGGMEEEPACRQIAEREFPVQCRGCHPDWRKPVCDESCVGSPLYSGDGV